MRYPTTSARGSFFGFGSRGEAAATQVCVPMFEGMVPRTRAPQQPPAARLTAASFALSRRAHCHRLPPRSRSAATSTRFRCRRCRAPVAGRRCPPADAASAHAVRPPPPAATRPPRASGPGRRASTSQPTAAPAGPGGTSRHERAVRPTYRLPLRMGAVGGRHAGAGGAAVRPCDGARRRRRRPEAEHGARAARDFLLFLAILTQKSQNFLRVCGPGGVLRLALPGRRSRSAPAGDFSRFCSRWA